MQSRIRAVFVATLSGTFSLSKSRLETLACVLIAMVSSRTVNLTHAACHLPDKALHASRYRRLQRFFQYVRLDQDAVARLVIGMLNLNRPILLALDQPSFNRNRLNEVKLIYFNGSAQLSASIWTRVALDRTNWRVGSTDINILVLAVVTRRFRVPLMWTLLAHQGNSDTDQRIALMERYPGSVRRRLHPEVSACRSR